MANKRKINADILILPVAFLAMAFGYFWGRSLGSNSIGRYSGSEKLKQVLELIDQSYVDKVNTDSIVDIVIRDLTEHLDPHSVFLNAQQAQAEEDEIKGSYSGIGIIYTSFVDTPIVLRVLRTGMAWGRLCPGDKLLSVKEQNRITDLTKVPYDSVPYYIKGPDYTEIVLTVLRNNSDTLDIPLMRKTFMRPSVYSYMADSSTLYIKISSFTEHTSAEFYSQIISKHDSIRNVIIDLRGNSGGLLSSALQILDYIFGSKELVCFLKNKDKIIRTCYSEDGALLDSANIIVLIDNSTASASEVFAGAIQDLDRGIIIGTQSFGKGLVQSEFALSDGSALRLTTSRYYTPSGRCIQKDYEEYYGKYAGNGNADTTMYKTRNGRPVRAGNGIYPDIVVADISYVQLFEFYFDYQFFSNYAGKLCSLTRDTLGEPTMNCPRASEVDSLLDSLGYPQVVRYGVMHSVTCPEEYLKWYNSKSPVFQKAVEVIKQGNFDKYLYPSLSTE